MLLLTVAVIGGSRVVEAYRPFATEDAGVAGKGVAQLEMSWDYLKWGNGDQEHVLLIVPIYGITRWWEMSVELPWLFHDPEGDEAHIGVGDINVVTKFLILREGRRRPAFVLKGVVKTNSGNEDHGLGSGDLNYTLMAAASKELGPVTLHAMFGYTFVGDDGDPNIHDIFLYGLAADWAFMERLHLVAEVNGRRHSDRRVDQHPIDGLLGATFKISDAVTLDGALRFGFNDSVPDVNTTLGTSITF